ncbi:hypothetical protein RHMOL_Rhmol03G0124400 [Rhododendron molle]|uniref:Uncharacterized protein n=1 Tax=Rhododendron molle TaxID=49168 RepID=A0ACC0PEQ6_RHOML|nr:hypothetical protein RHMOL_Rhmol03G0124400 [Rhododendron molle]
MDTISLCVYSSTEKEHINSLFRWRRKRWICEAAEFVVLVPFKFGVWLSFEGAADKHCSRFKSTWRWICEEEVRPQRWQIWRLSNYFTLPNPRIEPGGFCFYFLIRFVFDF